MSVTHAVAILAVVLLASATGAAEPPSPPPRSDVRTFFEAASSDEGQAQAALATLSRHWRDADAALLIDIARFFAPARPARAGSDEWGLGLENDTRGGGGTSAHPGLGGGAAAPAGPSMAPAFEPAGARTRRRIVRFLGEQTGQRFGDDLRAWRRWLWSRPYEPHPDHAIFKATLYAQVDPRMAGFFRPGGAAAIRLDEIDWGGVPVNGIPPLDHPAVLPAAEARFLKDGHIVFGVKVGGQARAYPKRIVGWHELVRDRLGGVELTIVYCTLCGTVIPYASEVGGVRRAFGTSGLLYRSNKLLFDEETRSLWSTLDGRPVVGPLVGKGLVLEAYPVVTTTWREWRTAHPGTTVVSLATGFTRDYSEGAAYRDYFATDRLMFEVPRTDERLPNKAEVLALLLPPAGGASPGERHALAVSIRLLDREPVRRIASGGHDLVVITSPGGANRVYDAGGIVFTRLLPDGVADATGRAWAVTEEALVPPAGAEGAAPRPRIPAWRAFWFGWQAQFPNTELVR